jgi:5-(carboxyamino)imidazole ribonucleotide synthase
VFPAPSPKKATFTRCGVPCAPHAVIHDAASLAALPDGLWPGILKTAQLGYDGKGQRRVNSSGETAAAWRELGGARCVLERRLDLACELSVVLARGANGDVVSYPPFRNLHRDGILAVTQWPAPGIDAGTAQRADSAARAIASALEYVGVLCIEFFVLRDGSLCANEMAPRPHNSGHCTIDGANLSQFEYQVRTLAGLPLPPPRVHSSAVMLNLLGDLWRDGAAPPWERVLALPGVHLHLYGKTQPRAGRKMGHLTVTAPTLDAADGVAREAARALGIAPW